MRTCSRKRKPSRCSSERTRFSGVVSLPRMRLMFHERRSRESRSLPFLPLHSPPSLTRPSATLSRPTGEGLSDGRGGPGRRSRERRSLLRRSRTGIEYTKTAWSARSGSVRVGRGYGRGLAVKIDTSSSIPPRSKVSFPSSPSPGFQPPSPTPAGEGQRSRRRGRRRNRQARHELHGLARIEDRGSCEFAKFVSQTATLTLQVCKELKEC
jgi:hypothetical protein